MKILLLITGVLFILGAAGVSAGAEEYKHHMNPQEQKPNMIMLGEGEMKYT